MGRSPCSSKEGLNRGAWTVKEDMILTEYIRIHGDGEWTNLPQKAGLKRRGKSCRLRWLNYLRPDIKRGNISPDEEDLIIRMHRLIGNRWSLIAGRLPGRTDNEIKNYWNTHLKKKLRSMNESQTNSSTESLEKSSKSPPLLRKAETEIKFSTCSISDQQSSHSEHISGDATTLDKSSFYLKELSSPQWNQLLSPSYCSTYFGLEEFYMEPVTMAAESEDIFSDQSNMQLFNSFRVADYAGMEEFHDNAQDTDSISELNYF